MTSDSDDKPIDWVDTLLPGLRRTRMPYPAITPEGIQAVLDAQDMCPACGESIEPGDGTEIGGEVAHYICAAGYDEGQARE